jgi:hypothetical protein
LPKAALYEPTDKLSPSARYQEEDQVSNPSQPKIVSLSDVLRWSPDGGSSSKEIVRQRWNFSPPETTREVEEYQVELSNVSVLELIITPNVSGGAARASLKSMLLS